jgi:hypothetical protein
VVARGGVKPGHFRGRTFSKSDSKRDGRGCSRWRFTQRFDGLSSSKGRAGARVFGLSRDTIAKMCRYSAPPGYVRSKAPERPKLGLLGTGHRRDPGVRQNGAAQSGPGLGIFIASLGFSIRYTATIVVIVEIFLFPTATPPLRIVAMQRCSGLNGYERSHPRS